jgi:large subunit ribosomal protein L18
MAQQNLKQTVGFRRKREGRTNYKKRLSLLKSGKCRIIIRKTNKQIILQIAQYKPEGDKILCGTNSNSLAKQGWNYSFKNLPACYLAGLLLGKKALTNKINEAIFDAGLQTPVAGSRIYAALKGVIDAGLNVPVSEEVFPLQERLSGKSIAVFFANQKDSKFQFANYKKKNLDSSKLQADFEACKKKILNG